MVKLLWRTRLLVGVEGSSLLHALYTMNAPAGILTIQPPLRVTNIIKDFTDALGWSYGAYICLPDASASESFVVDDMNELDRLIDRMLGVAPHH